MTADQHLAAVAPKARSVIIPGALDGTLSPYRLRTKGSVATWKASQKKRSDVWQLSTLSSYIAAVGGELEILARFPDRDPVRITQFKPLKRGRKVSRTAGEASNAKRAGR
jgi:hypothetical protein